MALPTRALGHEGLRCHAARGVFTASPTSPLVTDVGTSPRVSICIPTYNQAQFLGQCLEGALAQTYDDYEVVLSVNHCTDDTDSVVARYAGHPRLVVVRPPRFLSSGENFHFVIQHGRGEYFNYLSSDDWLYPDFLQALVPILDDNPAVDFAFSASTFSDESGKVININRSLTGDYVRNGYRELSRYIPRFCATGDALLVRRSAYDAVGGIRTQIVDWELCLKLLCHGDVGYTNRILCNVRIWSNQDRATSRKVQFIAWLREFFDETEAYVCQRYPEFALAFAHARFKRALKESLNLDNYPDELRPRAVHEIEQLSDDWRLGFALHCIDDFGLGKSLRLLTKANTRLRFWAKQWLFTREIGV